MTLSSLKSLIRRLVEAETPDAVNDCIVREVAGEAECGRVGTHLICRWRGEGPQIMALGHSDTVWPPGTLREMPFREADGRLWGPGALDMKTGLALFIWAMRRLDGPRNVLLQINSDEETGSHDSKSLTETNALESKAVLVLEPGTGLEGKLKTARKGVGSYTVCVRGIASHAGVDFESGASAITELARQIDRIAAFSDAARGTTVNPGVIRGGTLSNVVAAEAEVEIDIRVRTMEDLAALDRKFASLRPFDGRCSLQIEGGLNRPPMERRTELFRLARQFNASLEESATGGGSDGNFTAFLGVPTLDGLGAVGEGAHARHESVLVDRFEDRIALLAWLISRIPSSPDIPLRDEILNSSPRLPSR